MDSNVVDRGRLSLDMYHAAQMVMNTFYLAIVEGLKQMHASQEGGVR